MSTHPFFKRFPDPQASVPHSVSGYLAWTEGDSVAECGAEAVVTEDDGALRPVHLVVVDDLTSFAVALELSPEAAEALAARLVETARAVRAFIRETLAMRGVTLGTRCPGCGISDDLPMDSAPLPENDKRARAYCTTCGRRVD